MGLMHLVGILFTKPYFGGYVLLEHVPLKNQTPSEDNPAPILGSSSYRRGATNGQGKHQEAASPVCTSWPRAPILQPACYPETSSAAAAWTLICLVNVGLTNHSPWDRVEPSRTLYKTLEVADTV